MSEQLEFDYDVFISYSSHNKEWVRGVLLTGIEKAGLRAFVDFRNFKPGAPSIKEMERGVSICRKMLLVLTPDYIESEWCEIENIMLQTLSPANRDLRLIPLLKMRCEKPLRIAALAHIDFTDGANLDLAWQQLINALGAPSDEAVEKAIPPEIQAELERAKALTDADKFTQAIPILEDALKVADGSDHTVAKVKVRLSLGNALYTAREDFSGAEKLFRDALILVPTAKLDLRHSVLHNLGEMLLFCGRVDEANATLHAAHNVAKQSGRTDDLVVSLISLSLLERALGFHENAIVKLDEALQVLLHEALSLLDDQKKDHARKLAVCYINKAILYQDAGDLDEALVFHAKTEEQYRISGDKLDAGKALLLCGEVHCEKADWEKGFKCFQRAMELLLETANPLWVARGAERISRLYATHERWEEATQAMLAAAAGAEEAGHPGERVHFLCLAAQLLRKWRAADARENLLRSVHRLANDTPKRQQGEVMSGLSAKMGEMSDAIEEAVRKDEQVLGLLQEAKVIAQKEHLHGHLANCLLDEAHDMTPLNDTEARHGLIVQAIELLQEELLRAEFPKHRAHTMQRISNLYRELGNDDEEVSWLRKAGDIFKKCGDVFGLANYHTSLAEMHREEGRLDDEIASYREVLSLIQGRSFHYLAAGTRINLAAALRYRQEFGEAQKLLNEAEVLCERHHFQHLISIIARNQTEIEERSEASQAPTQTLSQLLSSLGQLLDYRPDLAEAYLSFWYFTWKTQLLALLRSGPHLSLMVLTDDVKRFMEFAAQFHYLADHFFLTTSHPFTVKIEPRILPIPPTWLFPPTFPFLAMKKHDLVDSPPTEQDAPENQGSLPSIHLTGPATMLPPYALVDEKSDVEGEGHIMTLSPLSLPQEAIELMVGYSIQELIQWRVVWFPTERFSSKDPFLADLRIGHEQGVFPVYFNSLPASDSVTVCGAVQIAIPSKLLSADDPSATARWRRALMKLAKLPKEEAHAALLDLPEVFSNADNEKADSIAIEIWLFEFREIDRRIVHPALLVRG